MAEYAYRTVNVFAEERHANEAGMVKIYVCAETGDEQVVARFFFGNGRGSIAEGPGTGSACANLGGWMISAKKTPAADAPHLPGRPHRPSLPPAPQRGPSGSDIRRRAGDRTRARSGVDLKC